MYGGEAACASTPTQSPHRVPAADFGLLSPVCAGAPALHYDSWWETEVQGAVGGVTPAEAGEIPACAGAPEKPAPRPKLSKRRHMVSHLLKYSFHVTAPKNMSYFFSE